MDKLVRPSAKIRVFLGVDFSKIKNIIFDLGDVIINIDPTKTYAAFARLTDQPLDQTLERFNELQVFQRYERGEFTDTEFIQFLRDELALTQSDEVIIEAWNQILLDIPKERIEIIQSLKGKYRLFLLSNTSNIHILETCNILRETTGVKRLHDLFEITFLSYEMKLSKPDHAIYHEVLRQAEIEPHETLFLDDNADNIRAAGEVGIQTIHVIKPTSIVNYLADA